MRHTFPTDNKDSTNNDKLNLKKTNLLFKGDIVDGYKVIEIIGVGGMGQVYLVENIHMHKLYTLKALPVSLSQNKIFIDQFKIEARIMADLKHKNIVNVHNIGYNKDRELYYLVMEYIKPYEHNCHDLESKLQNKKKLTEKETLNITRQLCLGLEYAHSFNENGIIHRNLKPSNILLDIDDNVYITDFGLARMIDTSNLTNILEASTIQSIEGISSNKQQSLGEINTLQITNSIANSVFGTYDYMSPEQQDGKIATKQSDIYSLGLIIYRMLTGQRAKGLFKMPSSFGLNKRWDAILRKCLQQDPKERFSSASEIINMINEEKDKTEEVTTNSKENAEKFLSITPNAKSILFGTLNTIFLCILLFMEKAHSSFYFRNVQDFFLSISLTFIAITYISELIQFFCQTHKLKFNSDWSRLQKFSRKFFIYITSILIIAFIFSVFAGRIKKVNLNSRFNSSSIFN